jgi:hypothetical protein
MGFIKFYTLCINYTVGVSNKQVCNHDLKYHDFHHEICSQVNSESLLAMEYHFNSIDFKIQIEA